MWCAREVSHRHRSNVRRTQVAGWKKTEVWDDSQHFFFDGCGMLYMSIFHRVDFFHHDFMGFSCPTFVILLHYLELQVIEKSAPGVNIELKLENPYPNKRNVFSKHDDLFLQREIWKMDPPCDAGSMAEIDAYGGKLRIADGKMHHLKVYFFWNRKKYPLIFGRTMQLRITKKKGKPTWKKHLQSIGSFFREIG